VISSILLGAVPIFLLYVVRRLADLTRRQKELDARLARLERLEAQAGQYERVT
jgi:hypothetical protein